MQQGKLFYYFTTYYGFILFLSKADNMCMDTFFIIPLIHNNDVLVVIIITIMSYNTDYLLNNYFSDLQIISNGSYLLSSKLYVFRKARLISSLMLFSYVFRIFKYVIAVSCTTNYYKRSFMYFTISQLFLDGWSDQVVGEC